MRINTRNEAGCKRAATFRTLMAIASAAALLASSLTLAADGRAAQMEQRLDQAKVRLNLTDQQFEQMVPVLEQSMLAQRKVLTAYGIDLDDRNGSRQKLGLRKGRAMKQELGVVRASTLDAVDDILTAEQLEEFKRIQDERRAAMRERIRTAR